MIHLTINGVPTSVPKGTTVYHAAKQLDIEIPIFCYQDRMPPFGACRVCLVEVEKMAKLQTSCTLEATKGMVVKTQSQIAVEGREHILEFLLVNHPLDCPICDRGGKCHLQDQALKYGNGASRFTEEKRYFKKPLAKGPVLMINRERCIICARCTRFGDEIAGDNALEILDRGFVSEVGTRDGGPAKSKFIGNTIMICPVGALTSQVYRFRARPWDDESTKTTCALCPVGCSMILNTRDGEITRTLSDENKDVNDIWLCDKGWFGYEFTNDVIRLQKPLIRREGKLEPASWVEALSLIARKMQEAKESQKLAALGGNPLTVEENYLFQKLIREWGGVNHIDHRVGSPILSLEEEGIPPGMEISIGECEELSFVLLCGVDLTEEFPVIWLRLKQAINRKAHVAFLGHFSPEIAKHLTKTVVHPPGKELQTLQEQFPQLQGLMGEGKKGAIFVGRQYLDNPDRKAILSKLQELNLPLNLLEGSGNSFGARFAGMRPDLGPLSAPIEHPGLDAVKLMEIAAKTGWDLLYVAGANPAVKFPAKLWNQVRSKLGFLVVQDLFLTETAEQADVVLPTLCYVEKYGSFINVEGRIQKIQPGKDLPQGVYSDSEIFILLAQKLHFSLNIDQNFWKHLNPGRLPQKEQKKVVGNEPAPASNGLVASFAPALFDHGVRMRHNEHVVQMAEAPRLRIHPDEGLKHGLEAEDLVTLSTNENHINAQVEFDPQVAMRTVVLPLGFPEVPVHDLGTHLLNGMEITIERRRQ